MDNLSRYRIFNSNRITIFFVFLVGIFVSWFFQSGMYEYTIGFNSKEEDIIGVADQVQKSLISQVLNLFNYVTSSGNFISFVLPVLASAMVILFIKEKNGLFFFKYTRNINYKGSVISNILIQSLLSGCTFLLAYTIFLLVGVIICKTVPESNVEAFDYVFGSGFSVGKNAWIGYIVEGLIKCGLFPFVYTFFSCSISLIIKKAYQCIIIPVIFYFFGTIVLSAGLGLVKWSPAYSTVSLCIAGTFVESMLPLLIPMGISIAIILFSLKKGEKIL